MSDSLPDIDSNGAPPPAGPTETEKPLPVEKPKPSLGIRALRWILGFLIVFGLGAAVALYLFYLPARKEVQNSQADLQNANQKISELQKKVDTLTPLDTRNQELQSQIDKANLHINILSARADAATALAALAKNDPTKARVALSKTSQTLDTIASLIKPDQKKAATDMQARLKLAQGEIGGNSFAAESDLNVLATSLMEIENSYFAGP